jgi:dihydrolipoamide dehydrogenase
MMEIILKKLSGEDKKARIGKIMIKENQEITAGDVLFNAESAKGNFQVKSEYQGKITKIFIEEGSSIALGQPIAQIDGCKVNQPVQPGVATYSFGLAKPKKETLDCDIAIIGGGPGGYVAAIRAAQLGAKVILIEKDKIGGTCLNYGCIPTKTFVKSAHLYDEILKSEEFGIKIEKAVLDMNQVVKRKNEKVEQLSSGIKYLLNHWGVRLIQGEAKIQKDQILVKTNKIEADITAKNIIIAAGSSAAKLNINGADLPKVLTNKEILNLNEIPQSLTIVGGGVIGMEFAFIFNSLGSKVTVVEFMDRILFNLDEDIIEMIERECEDRGISLYTSSKVESIMNCEDQQILTQFSKEGQAHYVVGDYVLMAVGRRANLDAVDLEQLNVKLNESGNGIAVDDHMLTSNKAVYAIGDITNKIQLAHIASHQGIVAVENIMGLPTTMNYSAVPSAIFLSPEIGVVGMCEKEAIKKGIEYKIGKFPFSANGKALTLGETKGFVKVIINANDNSILGASIIGPNATDLIANFTFLIENKIDFNRLSHTIFAHPTTAESIQEAVLNINGGSIHFV